jgi:hypothetical protein
MSKSLASLAAFLMLCMGTALAQEAPKDEKVAPPAAAKKAETPNQLDELQKELNKVRRSETATDAKGAVQKLLDAPESMKGLSAEAQIKFRKALENFEKTVTGLGAAQMDDKVRAQLDEAQGVIDAERLAQAQKEKADQAKIEKGGLIALGIVAAIILLPVILMLLIAAPEVFFLLLIIGILVCVFVL